MKYGKVWHDGRDHWIFETRIKGPAKMQCGVPVDAKAGVVGMETPIASIAGHMPYSDFQPFKGALPDEVKRLIDAAPEPAGDE